MNSLEEIRFKLNDAQIAHHDYERETGRPDANWSDWYASYMTRYGIEVDENELAALIREADNAFQNAQEQESWQLFTARYIFDKLQS